MRVWVVTGPIGAGKSLVTGYLQDRGAVIVDADKLGHQVLENPAMVQAIGREFGPEVLVAGKVDRRKLGSLVFSDPAAMARLNAMTHPPLLALVSNCLAELAREGKHELAVVEAAVYFLWPPLQSIDLVVSVVADEEIRLRRLITHRGLTADQAKDRLMAQEPLAPFWETADVLLSNNGDLKSLKRQVDKMMDNNNQ
jgi:dephospho-CoA kinase